MILLSFRYEPNSAVVLHEMAYQRVAAIARAAGIPVCAAVFEKDLWMFQKATVVWHGVGATSYLKLTASEKNSGRKERADSASKQRSRADPYYPTAHMHPHAGKLAR